jgi:hypothetical protein
MDDRRQQQLQYRPITFVDTYSALLTGSKLDNVTGIAQLHCETVQSVRVIWLGNRVLIRAVGVQTKGQPELRENGIHLGMRSAPRGLLWGTVNWLMTLGYGE